MKYKSALLKLFQVSDERQLRMSDRILIKHLLSRMRQPQSGGGFSIRPDLSPLGGMVQFTGYVDRFAPVFVGPLLDNVAFQLRQSL